MSKPLPDPKIMKQVFNLRLMKFDKQTVAEQFNISPRTVDKYYYIELKKRRPPPADKEAFINELNAAQEKRVSELWTIASDSKLGKRERLQAYKLLQDEEDLAIHKGQLIGLLPKEGPLALFQQNNTSITSDGKVYSLSDAFREVYGGTDKKILEVKELVIDSTSDREVHDE
jgi:hypothetical protein